MSIRLTPDQERFIQAKVREGHHRSAEEALEIALKLLDEYDRNASEWAAEVREKIDAAIANVTPPIDGELFVNDVLWRFQSWN
ncbi:MAG: type II toxin-antitoxin system ParD family antitoxin [Cyanobacteria bacterium J06641_5]